MQLHSKPNASLPPLVIPGKSQSIQGAGQAAGRLLKETDRFFIRGGALVEVIHGKDGEPYLQPLKATQLASEMELVARIVRVKGDELESTVLSGTQAQLIMDSSSFRNEVPEITILSKSPVITMGANQQIRIITGYDKESGILSFAADLEEVPLDAAVALILDLLSDFNFATPADRSRAIASLITPAFIFGQILKVRAPLSVVEADESQTGKGFLVKLIAAIYNHQPHAITQRKGGCGGIEESLNMRLVKGDSFISFDNIRGKLDSPALESFLTENHYLARIPFMAPMDIDPKRVVLFFTSNQCEMTKDLTNRSSLIQLRKQEPGYAFKSFPEGDVIDHILANNTRYYGAIVAIIKEWVLQGSQETKEDRHDFRRWARVLDWIVQHIMHLPPLMDGHRDTQRRLVNKQINWIRGVSFVILKKERQHIWLRTADIIDLIEDAEVSIPGLKDMDHIADSALRNKILIAMGREIGLCFKGSRKIPIGDDVIDEIIIDDIRVQRRVVVDVRGGTSGSIETKEYRFVQQELSAIAASPSPPSSPPSAAIATMPLKRIARTQMLFQFDEDIPNENEKK